MILAIHTGALDDLKANRHGLKVRNSHLISRVEDDIVLINMPCGASFVVYEPVLSTLM